LKNGIFFNKKMIESGGTKKYTFKTPYKYQKEFKAVEKS
jgi:hypothetical protein